MIKLDGFTNAQNQHACNLLRGVPKDLRVVVRKVIERRVMTDKHLTLLETLKWDKLRGIRYLDGIKRAEILREALLRGAPVLPVKIRKDYE